MSIYLLEILIQVALVVHIVRTGRSFIWIYVVVFLPLAGPIAYFIVEVLPGWMGSHTARKLGQGAVRQLDPGRDLRRRLDALEGADTIENRRLAAEAYMELGRFDEARGLYREALVGMHADDPALLLGAARAAYGAGVPQEALDALEHLQEANPGYQSAEGHLLYAKSLEGVGRDDEARAEYEALVASYPGEEVRCRLGLLLKKHGAGERANTLFREILDRARRGNSRYRGSEREWIDIARREAAG